MFLNNSEGWKEDGYCLGLLIIRFLKKKDSIYPVWIGFRNLFFGCPKKLHLKLKFDSN